jgi:hypothetical protein
MVVCVHVSTHKLNGSYYNLYANKSIFTSLIALEEIVSFNGALVSAQRTQTVFELCANCKKPKFTQ